MSACSLYNYGIWLCNCERVTDKQDLHGALVRHHRRIWKVKTAQRSDPSHLSNLLNLEVIPSYAN